MTKARGLLCICIITAVLELALSMIAHAKYEDWETSVVNRKDEKTYVISNLASEDIMSPICGSALLRKDHCTYVSLADLGSFGKRGNDLLPYDWRKDETVIVLDRSKLDGAGKALAAKLLAEVFPTIPSRNDADQITIATQEAAKRSCQALIDVPETMWLDQAVGDIKRLGFATTSTFPVQNVAVFSNDSSCANTLLSQFQYGKKQIIEPGQLQVFRDATGLSHKIAAINWNAEEECTVDTANEILPTELRSACDNSTRDRVGLTPWQQFCRSAVAQSFSSGGTEYWVLRAPTAKHLSTLTNMVVKSGFKGGPFQLPLCDLSYVRSIAVGTYVQSPDPDRQRLVIQNQMETVAQDLLQTKVKSLASAQDWGKLVQNVLGDSAVGNPFRDSGGAQQVVRASNADALLVLWIRDVSPALEYSCTRSRITPPMPAFTETEPRRPDPDESGLSGHKYPSIDGCRSCSHEYQRDLSNYYDKHASWERDINQYEGSKHSRLVNYEYQIVSTPKITLLGYLKVIDLRTQTQLWSCDVSIDSLGDAKPVRTVPAQVRGDDTEPQMPELPENTYSWTDSTYSIGQNAIFGALKQGIVKMTQSVLWGSDLKPWNMPMQASIQDDAIPVTDTVTGNGGAVKTKTVQKPVVKAKPKPASKKTKPVIRKSH